MPRYCPRCGEALHSHSTTKGEVRKTARRAYEPKAKPKRKASAYSKKYGRAFKKVAPKHKKKTVHGKKMGSNVLRRKLHRLARRS